MRKKLRNSGQSICVWLMLHGVLLNASSGTIQWTYLSTAVAKSSLLTWSLNRPCCQVKYLLVLMQPLLPKAPCYAKVAE